MGVRSSSILNFLWGLEFHFLIADFCFRFLPSALDSRTYSLSFRLLNSQSWFLRGLLQGRCLSHDNDIESWFEIWMSISISTRLQLPSNQPVSDGSELWNSTSWFTIPPRGQIYPIRWPDVTWTRHQYPVERVVGAWNGLSISSYRSPKSLVIIWCEKPINWSIPYVDHEVYLPSRRIKSVGIAWRCGTGLET